MYKYFIVFQAANQHAARLINAEVTLIKKLGCLDDVQSVERTIRLEVNKKYPDTVVTIVNWRLFDES